MAIWCTVMKIIYHLLIVLISKHIQKFIVIYRTVFEICFFLLFVFYLLLHKIYSIHESNNIHTYKKHSKNKNIIIMVSYNYVYTSIITISVTCINEKSIYR